jgi:quinol monooxygenase YgiN
VDNRNNFVMTEVWDSKEHYAKYLAFRTEEGTMDAIASMCLDAPTIRIFDITEA